MEYRRLGKAGVKVSPICLGTGVRGPDGLADEARFIRTIERAIDLAKACPTLSPRRLELLRETLAPE